MTRAFVWLLSAWFALSPAFADSAFVAPTATGTAATGQIPGTATNDNATAGNVGEYAESVVTAASATVTFTNASPTVVTWTGHPYSIPSSGIIAVGVINFTNSGGALPTGISAINYYARPIDANTLHIGTTVANAIAGTFVNTSSTGTGIQTGNAEALLTSATNIDMAGLALTAGDWECRGNVGIDPAAGTVTTIFSAGINSTSATLPGVSTRGAYIFNSATEPTASVQQFPLGIQRFLLSATTNIFLINSPTFSTSTNKGFGLIACRRPR